MALLKQIGEAPWVQRAVGIGAAQYLRLVWKTSTLVVDPPDFYERVAPDLPAIVAMWHGHHFMMPFTKRAEHRIKVLISRHRDGEVNAVAAERLGIRTIRGSGDPAGRFDRKGGVSAFKTMLSALKENWTVALTADVPKNARIAGLGIVKLAQFSGRPIYPVVIATSRRFELDNWDRSVVNLPFSRCAIVGGEAIRVAADADDAALERARRAVEAGLNAAVERAYDIVDRRRS
jgi:lysophospholipid acyltransferase (LPLAT)-like uncharacterized protein